MYKKDDLPMWDKLSLETAIEEQKSIVDRVLEPEVHLTDMGNAARLAFRHGHNLRYCHPWNKWLVWDGTRWVADDTAAVYRMARETVRSIYTEAALKQDQEVRKAIAKHAVASENRIRLTAMIMLAQSEEGIPILPNDLDQDPWLLNCVNGTVDLTTGELKPHRREDLITKTTGVIYDRNAKAPLWEKFLHDIMDGNVNLINFLQRAAGMSLAGVIKDHILLVCYGTGRNGKSTFLEILQATMGDYGMNAAPDLLLSRQGQRHPTEVADLFGKRFVAAIETDEGCRLNEALVKYITGGDTIKARRMREDFWQFKPTHTLWLATNHKPVIRGTDLAIWSRLKLIPFTVTFDETTGRSPDKDLPKKLLTELSGILTWAVEGCIAWQKDGLGVPDEVKRATDGYRAEQDVIGAFIEECCIVSHMLRAYASDLYQTYVKWCSENGETPLSQRKFAERLTEKGFKGGERSTGGRMAWLGIGLRD